MVGLMASPSVVDFTCVQADPVAGTGLQAFYQTEFQSNLFNLPAHVLPIGGGPRGDIVHTVGINALQRFKLGRQLLDVGGRYQHDVYQRYTYLNNNTSAAHLILNYNIGSSWSGDGGFRYTQTTVSFAESNIQERNLALERLFFANAYFRRNQPGFQANMKVSRDLIGYTLSSYTDSKAIIYDLSAGMEWLSPTGWRYGLQETYNEGRYPSRSYVTGDVADTGYVRNDLRATLVRMGQEGSPLWGGSLGIAQQRYPHLGGNDFTAVVGDLYLTLRPGARLNGGLNLSRSVYALATVESSFVLRDQLKASTQYQLTSKTELYGDALFFQDSYQGQGASRVDRNGVVGGGVRWKPARRWSVGFSYQYRTRRSNESQYNFINNIYQGRIQYAF